MAPSSKRPCRDTELRLGGCADDAPAALPLRAREKIENGATTAGAHCCSYDGDRLLTLMPGGRGVDVTGAEVQASAIIRMARAAAGAQAPDSGASRRRRSLRRFLRRRRERLRSSPPYLRSPN